MSIPDLVSLAMRRWFLTSVTSVVLVSPFFAACSDDEAFPPISVDTDFQAPDPADGKEFDQYIASRVQAFYSARDAAFANPSAQPETDHPQLAKLSAEQQLDVVLEESRSLHRQGRAHAESENPAIGTNTDDEHRTSGVQSVSGNTVTVLDCEVNDDVVIEESSGEVQIDGVLTVLRVMTFRKIEGDWKVTYTEVTERYDGVGGCFLADEDLYPH